MTSSRDANQALFDPVMPQRPAPDPTPTPRVDFQNIIKEFNAMYGLPVSGYPTMHNLGIPMRERMRQFKRNMEKEIEEADLITQKLDTHQDMARREMGELGLLWDRQESEIDILADLGDWLGDIIVYAASEMVKYGLPMNAILDIIMASNASKLGANGQPIVEDGKLMKGPYYWKPEPKIRDLLRERSK